MKKRSREINIFSMSALDLFASALGAFILITLVLFPFFPNTGDSPERIAAVRGEMERQMAAMAQAHADATAALQQQVQDAQQQAQQASASASSAQASLSQCQVALDQATQQLNATSENLQSCRAALQQTFVLVVISWNSDDDVDLHVVDPRGNEYYYAERTFTGSEAALEEDTTDGPGNEIWLSPSAIPGRYEIYTNLFSNSSGSSVSVRGSILHQDGRISLPATTLRSTGDKPMVASFTVDDEGNVTVN